ncbi:Putative ribonuclease H protein At1g65750 [Linum perenne]
MLGKQGWKLFSNPNTLVSRVYKAKYYPKEDFLQAEEGYSPSYVWKSVRASQDIIRRGFRWKIGDGRNVKVWDDPWLREDADRFVRSGQEEGLERWCVKDLTRLDGGGWDEEVIDVLFDERDANAIMRVRPPTDGVEDRKLWHFSKNGEYSVRSAYRLAADCEAEVEELRPNGEWRRLWQMEVPPKMRHLLWRASRGVLPTRSALNRRGIYMEDKCELCGELGETVTHLFLNCEVSKRCWRLAGGEELLPATNSASVEWKDWWMNLLASGRKESLECMAAMAWGIWRERNDRVWNHKQKPEALIVKLATELIHDWKKAQQQRHHDEQVQAARGCDKWHKPPPTYIKINCDAAVFSENRAFGIGLIARDEDGTMLGYKMETRQCCLPVRECEAVAVVAGIAWAVEQGMHRVVIETDCQAVQLALEGNTQDDSEFGELIARGRALLQTIPRVQVKFVRRSGNTVAHVLARRSLFSSDTVYDSESPD